MASVPLDALVEDSEVVVVVTAHAGDGLAASTSAPTSSSTRRTAPRATAVRPRQVLRLGAGWATASARALAGSQQGMR